MSLSYPQRQKQLESLIQKLGLSTKAPIQWHLLDLALTHATISPTENYEQLEFVGDAVIRLAVAEFLFKNYANLPVGEFAAVRSILVSDRVLAKMATRYGLDRYLLVADNVLRDKAGQESLMAQAFEAVLAVLYLSTQNLNLVHSWLNSDFKEQVEDILQDPARKNYKAALQEWTQGTYKLLPDYRVSETDAGSGAEDRFMAEVWLQGEQLGAGKGRSIKAAEQAAAEAAFLAIKERER